VVNYRPIDRRPSIVVILVVVLGMALGACGTDDPAASSACGPDVTEPLDPRSAQHVLPGAPAPTYSSDPPTSGAHELGTLPTGVVGAPVAPPTQVTVLEEGGILLQYRDLDTSDRRRLESLAASGVVVAPNADLRSPVVATAWRHSFSCTAVDLAALGGFIDTYQGRGADGQ